MSCFRGSPASWRTNRSPREIGSSAFPSTGRQLQEVLRDGRGASASALHTNGLTGPVEWDVTADVVQALSDNAVSIQWLIRRAVEGQSGHAIYHSKEGAAALSNPDLAPTLKFEF